MGMLYIVPVDATAMLKYTCDGGTLVLFTMCLSIHTDFLGKSFLIDFSSFGNGFFIAFFMFAFALMCVPSMKTASAEKYPDSSISNSTHSNTLSITSRLYLCLKLRETVEKCGMFS